MHLEKDEVIRLVGDSIRKHRIEKRLSMERLALEAGLEYSQIRRIESGIINTSIYQVYRISRTLQIPMVNIFKDL